jgi:hypothetical protein
VKLHAFQGVEHAELVAYTYNHGKKRGKVGHLIKLKGREAYLLDALCERTGWTEAEALSRLLEQTAEEETEPAPQVVAVRKDGMSTRRGSNSKVFGEAA